MGDEERANATANKEAVQKEEARKQREIAQKEQRRLYEQHRREAEEDRLRQEEAKHRADEEAARERQLQEENAKREQDRREAEERRAAEEERANSKAKVDEFLTKHKFKAINEKKKVSVLPPKSTYPLHTAVNEGDAAMVRLLVRFNADVTLQDSGNKTALALAEKKGYQQCVNELQA